jgi:hypothetical protein
MGDEPEARICAAPPSGANRGSMLSPNGASVGGSLIVPVVQSKDLRHTSLCEVLASLC